MGIHSKIKKNYIKKYFAVLSCVFLFFTIFVYMLQTRNILSQTPSHGLKRPASVMLAFLL